MIIGEIIEGPYMLARVPLYSATHGICAENHQIPYTRGLDLEFWAGPYVRVITRIEYTHGPYDHNRTTEAARKAVATTSYQDAKEMPSLFTIETGQLPYLDDNDA